jgi:hypothetical protein
MRTLTIFGPLTLTCLLAACGTDSEQTTETAGGDGGGPTAPDATASGGQPTPGGAPGPGGIGGGSEVKPPDADAPRDGPPDGALADDAGRTSVDGAVADAGPPVPDPTLETLLPDAATAICGALFRCCDGDSLARYFEPYARNEALLDFAPRLPPVASVTAETCPGLVAEMLTIVPLGTWRDAAADGLVRVVPAAVAACLASLETATCGDAVTAALFDATCFWLNPPLGGEEQRRIFERTASAGAACRPLNDGFGGVFFGTCDPHSAFCCHGEAGACDFPDGPAAEGVCQPASAEGEACSQLPVQLCRTGLECGDDGRCQAPDHTPLQPGEACIDDRFNLLGDCVDSFCDVFGTSRCTPRRADGEACAGPDECLSGACRDDVCGPPDFCDGL